MTTNGWWMLTGIALLAGAIAGAGLTLRIARVRHAAQMRRASDDLQHRFAASLDRSRAAQARAQAELEQTRAAVRRQLAVALEEPRAAAARAEERLRAAYVEIDRLRRASPPVDGVHAELSDGFAATRPMHEGL